MDSLRYITVVEEWQQLVPCSLQDNPRSWATRLMKSRCLAQCHTKLQRKKETTWDTKSVESITIPVHWPKLFCSRTKGNHEGSFGMLMLPWEVNIVVGASSYVLIKSKKKGTTVAQRGQDEMQTSEVLFRSLCILVFWIFRRKFLIFEVLNID